MRLKAISPLILQALMWPPTVAGLKFFGSLRAKGLENLSGLPQGTIFACNHSSELDPVLVPAALPWRHPLRPMFYTSRERAFYYKTKWRQIFYGGLLFRMLGAYPVLAGVHDYAVSLKNHIMLAKSGHSVIIFPEGKIYPENDRREARGGVGYLSWSSGAPVVPVAIKGGYSFSAKQFFLRRRKLSVEFGTPIYPSELFHGADPIANDQRDDFKTAAQIVMKKIRELYDRP